MQDILTEQEAKTRWCPLGRVAAAGDDDASSAVNRYSDGSDHPRSACIAGLCMAWRLAHKDSADGTERGYCGAFGLPRFT